MKYWFKPKAILLAFYTAACFFNGLNGQIFEKSSKLINAAFYGFLLTKYMPLDSMPYLQHKVRSMTKMVYVNNQLDSLETMEVNTKGRATSDHIYLKNKKDSVIITVSYPDEKTIVFEYISNRSFVLRDNLLELKTVLDSLNIETSPVSFKCEVEEPVKSQFNMKIYLNGKHLQDVNNYTPWLFTPAPPGYVDTTCWEPMTDTIKKANHLIVHTVYHDGPVYKDSLTYDYRVHKRYQGVIQNKDTIYWTRTDNSYDGKGRLYFSEEFELPRNISTSTKRITFDDGGNVNAESRSQFGAITIDFYDKGKLKMTHYTSPYPCCTSDTPFFDITRYKYTDSGLIKKIEYSRNEAIHKEVIFDYTYW